MKTLKAATSMISMFRKSVLREKPYGERKEYSSGVHISSVIAFTNSILLAMAPEELL